MDPIEDTLEAHLHRHSSGGSRVSVVLAVAVLGCLALLPWIRVGVSVQGTGSVRPAVETHELRAPAAGVVEAVYVGRGDRVAEGAELVRLRGEAVELERAATVEALSEVRASGRALELLLRDPSAPPPAAMSPRIRDEQVSYLGTRDETLMRLEHARADLLRHERLRDMVAPVEIEDRAHRVAILEGELARLDSHRLADLRERMHENRARTRDLELRLRELDDAVDRAMIRAPIDGDIEQLAPMSPGSFIQAGQAVARIVPSAGMVGEVWVAPKDVGLLRPGLPARLLIHAYDHREWGFLTGRIRAIASDVTLVDHLPRFRVSVELDRTALMLENGARGELMKGMTLQARFTAGDRTLWQLVHDRIDSRFNPRHPSQ